jgi:hypothetical protein
MAITDLLAWLVAVSVGLVVVLWSAVFVKAAIFEKDLVIAPFYVTGREDPDGRLARSLALMLQGRLRRLQRELEASQKDLISPEAPADGADVAARVLLVPRLISQPVTMSTMVFADSPSIDVKVAGIEFGGIAAWLDRVAARKRTLTLAVHLGDDEALVTANLEALPDMAATDLWLRTKGTPGEVVTDLAYALLQGRMAAANDVTAIGALELKEFQTLVMSLSTIAELNRRIASGRARSPEDFRSVVNSLSPLLDKVPEWPELIYLVAQVAERTDEPQRALALYEQLHRLDQAQPRLQPPLRRVVDSKITALGVAAKPAIQDRERAFIDAVREYERKLSLGPPHPEIVFMREPPEYSGAQAIWNEKRRRYEVNPEAAADSKLELEKYTALMGRFMAQHYARCLTVVCWDWCSLLRSCP